MADPLLPRIARGETGAIDACIDRYGSLVWSLARRLSPKLADAEDAVQEIFLDIWRNAERFDATVAEETTFVAMLARRRLIDQLRKSRREVDSQPIDAAALQYAAPPQTPAAELADDALRANACLERLRDEERRVLELSIFHGLPQAGIAEQTGLPLGTVKSHARRGLLQLRDCMQAASSFHAKGVAQV